MAIIGCRLMAGFVLGFEVYPVPGVYLDISLGVFNFYVYNPEEMED
tara:strand:- start:59 stop:196 length:138 start_codon:yes stop_codon:yes gene_type:complete